MANGQNVTKILKFICTQYFRVQPFSHDGLNNADSYNIVLLGVSLILLSPHLGVKFPQNPNFGVMSTHFKLNANKY